MLTIKKKDAKKWLQEFLMEINSQDNKATATPYYYALKYTDDEGQMRSVKVRDNIFFTEKAANRYIRDNAHDLPDNVYHYIEWGGRNPQLKKLLEYVGVVVDVEYEKR